MLFFIVQVLSSKQEILEEHMKEYKTFTKEFCRLFLERFWISSISDIEASGCKLRNDSYF